LPNINQNKGFVEELKWMAGKSFLVHEEACSTAEHIFSNSLKHGFKGLWVTRTDPSETSARFDGDVDVLWLSTADVGGCVNIDSLDDLKTAVKDGVSKGNVVVGVERLDYLVNRHGFPDVLNTLYYLSDLMVSTKNTMLVCVNQTALPKEHLAQLETEFSKLPVPDHSKDLMRRFDLFELLKFVHDNGSVNSKQIHKALGITRTTARKRLYELRELGFISILKNGRTNHIELTEKGLGCPLG